MHYQPKMPRSCLTQPSICFSELIWKTENLVSKLSLGIFIETCLLSGKWDRWQIRATNCKLSGMLWTMSWLNWTALWNPWFLSPFLKDQPRSGGPVGTTSLTSKGCRFDSWSRHIAGLWVWSLVRASMGGKPIHVSFSLQCFALGFSLPSALSKSTEISSGADRKMFKDQQKLDFAV